MCELVSALIKIRNGEGFYGADAGEIKSIARKALSNTVVYTAESMSEALVRISQVMCLSSQGAEYIKIANDALETYYVKCGRPDHLP